MFRKNNIWISYEDLISLFQIIDNNNDGVLSFDEFKSIVFNERV